MDKYWLNTMFDSCYELAKPRRVILANRDPYESLNESLKAPRIVGEPATVLKAFDTLYQLGYRLRRLGAREEYALLLYRELGPRLSSADPFSSRLVEAASLIESRAGYNVADIEARLARDTVEIQITCWVERGAHPAAARSRGCRFSEADTARLA